MVADRASGQQRRAAILPDRSNATNHESVARQHDPALAPESTVSACKGRACCTSDALAVFLEADAGGSTVCSHGLTAWDARLFRFSCAIHDLKRASLGCIVNPRPAIYTQGSEELRSGRMTRWQQPRPGRKSTRVWKSRPRSSPSTPRSSRPAPWRWWPSCTGRSMRGGGSCWRAGPRSRRGSDAGWTPDFLAETRAIREADWKVAPAPPDLLDRRVEITGPGRP